MEWIVLIIVGLIAGTFGSLLGLGGGIIVVPALLILSTTLGILAGITPQVAVGTSLLIMIFTGLSSTLAYMKQGKVDYKSGLLFFCGSGPGALVGVWLNRFLEVEPFMIYFGIFMIIVSAVLFIRPYLKPRPLSEKGMKYPYTDELGVERVYGYRPVLAIMIAFFVGMLSGLFGIGGGSLMVPAMIILFHFPPHMAVATSMFMILLSALTSSISHIVLGNVNWLYALALIPGAYIGGIAGAAINRRLSGNALLLALRIFLIIAAIRLIYQGMSGA
ncbi:sulfite exporter TauE/SafE family protein [Alkalihalophilus lindianensis]|uniref:Probable membrane transporter protein n=1 Tax=Alkalihalophilus lindianensis TaxID=1630542 RepID=A0ABU3X8G6_9BACI|nr:sulfite exporter TauE/SafE family protein [Alkalihalophilus lindianensis]MDV2684159.1 sulfite exporter TauE/SafE family protein [Alkalihalophilus lindianensis]